MSYSTMHCDYVPYSRAPRLLRLLWLWHDDAHPRLETSWSAVVCVSYVWFTLTHPRDVGVFLGVIVGLTCKDEWHRLWKVLVSRTMRERCETCGVRERDAVDRRAGSESSARIA